jgi:hypothetical protein
MDDLGYDYCSVAFLDILGWKAIVERSKSEPNLIRDMVEALVGPEQRMQFPSGPPPLESGFPVFSQFSDSIVISCSLLAASDPGGEAFDDWLASLCCDLLEKGYFVRGAIATGPMFHQGPIAFGPALVDAVELEKTANYPRIVVSRSGGGPLVPIAEGRHRDEARGEYWGSFRKDETDIVTGKVDDVWYFDYLGYHLFRYLPSGTSETTLRQELEVFRQPIRRNLTAFSQVADRSRGDLPAFKRHCGILAKYVWFAEYFNTWVEKLGCSLIDFQDAHRIVREAHE